MEDRSIKGADRRRDNGSRKGGGSTSKGSERQLNGVEYLGNMKLSQVYDVAEKGVQLAKMALAELNPELKCNTIPTVSITPLQGAFAASQSPWSTCIILDAPAQGVADNQREGDSIEGKDIEITFQARSSQPGQVGTSSSPTLWRICVIQDMEAGGGNVAPVQVSLSTAAIQPSLLQTYSAAAGVTSPMASFSSPINYDFEPRFRVLYDETVLINPATDQCAKTWITKVRHRQHVQFYAGTTTQTNISTQLLVQAINPLTGLYPAALANCCTLDATARFYFIDN